MRLSTFSVWAACWILLTPTSASATIFFLQSDNVLRVDFLAQDPIVYYTYFEPDSRTLVLDLLGVRFSHEMDGSPSKEFIQSVSGETVRESPLTNRIIIRLGHAVWESVERRDKMLSLFFRRVTADRGPVQNDFPAQDRDDDLAYRMGPADLITIEVLVAGAEESKRDQYRIPEDGSISYPLLGDIMVEGLTTAQLKKDLEGRLQQGYLVNPKVNVRIDEYRSKWVNVIGEVEENGRIYLGEGVYRLVDVLSEAGGLTENAGSRLIVNRRQEDEQIVMALSQLFAEERDRLNIVVQHGDVINVLPKEFFYIRGEVKEAGRFPLEEGVTILQAVSLAGGLTQWAARKDILLLRVTSGEKEELHINLKKIEGGKSGNIQLRDGDVIIVPRRSLL